MLRYQRLDAHLERLRKRVTEYLGGSPVPQEYLLGRSISDDDRVPYSLEELADAQIFRPHDLRSTPLQETPATHPAPFHTNNVTNTRKTPPTQVGRATFTPLRTLKHKASYDYIFMCN